MLMKYTIDSLEPLRKRLITDELLIEDRKWDFWTFLNMPVIQQFEQLAIQWLKRQKLFIKKEQEVITFKTFNTDSIIKTISEQVINYIRHFDESPKYIIIGPDVHEQIFMEAAQFYRQEIFYRKDGRDYLMAINVIMVRHMQGGFLLMPDFPNDQDMEVAAFKYPFR